MKEEKKAPTPEEEAIQAELAKLEDPKKKNSKGQMISNIVFLVALTAVVISLFFSLGEIQSILDTIGQVGQGTNYLWFLAAIGAALAFFFLYPLTLLILSKGFDPKSSGSDAYMVAAEEHFYNAVTPFAAGGQPIQIYSLTKKGMKAATATGLVLTNFIIYLTVLNAYEVVALIHWGDYADAIKAVTNGNAAAEGWLIAAAIMGYVFNLGFLVFVYALGLSKKVSGFLVRVTRWICKIKWIGRFLEPRIPAFEQYCENYQMVTKEIFHHKKHVALAFLVKIVVQGIFFCFPYFLIRSVGENLPFTMFMRTGLANAWASCAVCWLPTPGGTGGIEYAFSIVLVSLNLSFAKGQAISLLWRALSFYLILLLSLVFVIIYDLKAKKAIAAQASLKTAEKRESLLQRLERIKRKKKSDDNEKTEG